ncbi:MAG: hypothetical protein IT384_33980 [Deltaproteobacteria bacterium]|nr:hypothetical protein [Deltaproteobacteria bacterium]
MTSARHTSDATEFRCVLASGEQAPAVLERQDLRIGTAILRTSMHRKALPLAFEQAREGDWVLIVTTPETFEPVSYPAPLRAIRVDPAGGTRIELDGAVPAGTEGSPVVNSFAEVVGMVLPTAGVNARIAVPANPLRVLVADLPTMARPTNVATPPEGQPSGTASQSAQTQSAGSPAPRPSAPTDDQLGIKPPEPLVGELRGLSLAGAPAELLDRVERAQATERDPSASAEEKAAEWDALAAQAPSTAEIARGRAAEWRAYGRRRAELAARHAARDDDWRKVSRILALDVVSDEEKVAAAQAFVERHGEERATNPYAAESTLNLWLARGRWSALRQRLAAEPEAKHRVDLLTEFSAKYPFFSEARVALRREGELAARALAEARAQSNRPALIAASGTATVTGSKQMPPPHGEPAVFPWLQVGLGLGAGAAAAVFQGLALSQETSRDKSLGDSYAAFDAAEFDAALASARGSEGRREAFQVVAYVSTSVSALLFAWAAGQLWVF